MPEPSEGVETAHPAPPPVPERPTEENTERRRRVRSGPGPLAKLISLIVSVGLAWALTVAITAWLLGMFLSPS